MTLDSLQSYLAACLGFMSEINWMAVGAGVLLAARLLQDVPAAIESVVRMYRKWRNHVESNRN